MKIQPNFTGKIHVTVVKNEQWNWHDYKTTKTQDKKILALTQELEDTYTTREFLPEEKGDKLKNLLESFIKEKLEIPEPCVYTYKKSRIYNPNTNKTTHHFLLFSDNYNGKNINFDRTGVDIWI